MLISVLGPYSVFSLQSSVFSLQSAVYSRQSSVGSHQSVSRADGRHDALAKTAKLRRTRRIIVLLLRGLRIFAFFAVVRDRQPGSLKILADDRRQVLLHFRR